MIRKKNTFSTLATVAAAFTTFAGLSAIPAVAADPPATAEALLYSTMPSTAAHRPEMAMDGDSKTYFKTVYGMDDGDDFLVLLSQPIPVNSIKVVTGDNDGQDVLTEGFIDTAADGSHYMPAANFDASGVATANLSGKWVESFRIRVNRRRGIPSLVIREITIDSPTRITHVETGPGRGFYDISQAPDLAVWAAKAESQMESFWPDTAALLYSYDFITPNMVNVVYRTGPGVTGVAATGGGVMTVNIAWCRAHPDDTGLTVHETAHVIQAMSAYDPVWLIEGVADYIRWVKFEPQNYTARINVQRATYHDSYRTTATFLGWLELHYDPCLVTELNAATRFGHFKLDLFKQYCGKDVDTLWSEFIAAYKADPANIITTPTAAADRPRILPTVTPGTSVPVDLSSAYDSAGLMRDGASAVGGGLDGEGFAYPADVVGASQTYKDVTFKIGAPNKADVVTAKGNVIALPSGSYGSLWLLGTGIEGGQRAQSLVVTYTDGSTNNLVQNFSDWYQPGGFPGEARAIRLPYRLTGSGEKDERTFYIYAYGFALNPAKTVKSLTLPTNPYLKIVAVSLAK